MKSGHVMDVVSTLMEKLSGPLWYKPSSLTDLFNVLDKHSSNSVRLVGGNTGTSEKKLKDLTVVDANVFRLCVQYTVVSYLQ